MKNEFKKSFALSVWLNLIILKSKIIYTLKMTLGQIWTNPAIWLNFNYIFNPMFVFDPKLG